MNFNNPAAATGMNFNSRPVSKGATQSIDPYNGV